MAEEEESSTVRFHYVKAPTFRTVHVDGAIGGLHPAGRGVHFALYSERVAIPQQAEFALNSDGTLGDEVREARVSRGGIVRELQVDAVFDISTAIALREWLTAHIDKFQEALDQQ